MRRQLSSRMPAFLAVLLLIAPVLAPGVAHAQTTRNTGLQLTGDKPVQIEGDKLEVLEDKSVAIFTGNVSVVQGPTILRTRQVDDPLPSRTVPAPQ